MPAVTRDWRALLCLIRFLPFAALNMLPDSPDSVRLTRFVSVPRERVFRAWTVSEAFKEWWPPPDRYAIPAAEFDIRVGGRYRITMQREDGGVQYLVGAYVEVIPPERLVMTWTLTGTATNDGYEAVVTAVFQSAGGGTEITLVHEKLPRAALDHYELAWSAAIDRLGLYLARGS
jgi:uncharacterized protein YndB with AHSA1/START domain